MEQWKKQYGTNATKNHGEYEYLNVENSQKLLKLAACSLTLCRDRFFVVVVRRALTDLKSLSFLRPRRGQTEEEEEASVPVI